MGYFKDAFDIGAGVTLGNMAVNLGAQLGSDFVESKFQRAYVKYRSQSFDPVIRHDLNELLVFGRLPQRAYPFPNSMKSAKKEKFYKRHKIFTSLVLMFFGISFFNSILVRFGMFTDDMLDDLLPLYTVLSLAISCAAIAIIARRITRSGKEKLSQSFKLQLEYDGQQYWYVREYIRQALAKGEMDVNTAVVKICNTSLAQQFPDTVDKIEANAFYYRQKMGL